MTSRPLCLLGLLALASCALNPQGSAEEAAGFAGESSAAGEAGFAASAGKGNGGTGPPAGAAGAIAGKGPGGQGGSGNQGGAGQSGSAGSAQAGSGASGAGAGGASGKGGVGGSAGQGGKNGQGGGSGSAGSSGQGGASGKGGGGASGSAGAGGAHAGAGGTSGQTGGTSPGGAGGSAGAAAGTAGSNAGGFCGDGFLDPGEECDDGNTAGGDLCVAGCKQSCPNLDNGLLRSVSEPRTGHCYVVLKNPSSWSDAEAQCARLGKGYHLATIRSKEEDDWVLSKLHKAGEPLLWIGLRDVTPDSNEQWQWADGTKGLFSPESPRLWADNEPNDGGSGVEHGQEECAVILPDGAVPQVGHGLADADCGTPYWAVCESYPGPSCGDGVLDAGERCDDGNAADADACGNKCTVHCDPKNDASDVVVYDEANNLCLKLSKKDKKDWAGARAGCEALGPAYHLAKINDQATLDALKTKGFLGEDTWIGGYDPVADTTEEWLWVDGSPLVKASLPWADGEPNDGGDHVEDGAEECIVTKTGAGSKLDDRYCTSAYPFLCVYEPKLPPAPAPPRGPARLASFRRSRHARRCSPADLLACIRR